MNQAKTYEEAINMTNYALSKHAENMQAGFTIQTNYGDIRVSGEETKPFIALAKKMMANSQSRQWAATGRADISIPSAFITASVVRKVGFPSALNER
jgi:hypothetical protein